MSSLRQAVIDFHADNRQEPAKVPGDRRAGQDRRASDRRNNLYSFESRTSRLHFAAQAAGFGTYDLDCTTGDSVWSPELRTMAGLPQDGGALSTEQAEALVHPDDRPGFLRKLRASLNPEGTGQFEDEHRLLRPDGTICWVKTKGRTFFVGKGLDRWPLAATGVVMDMTASRAAEGKLGENREELERLVESAIDCIITIDPDQRIVRFNPSASRTFRCPAEDAIGSPLERFIPARYRAAHSRHVGNFVQGGTTARTMGIPGVFSGLRADGEEFPIEASIAKVQVDDRQCLTVFLRDITERVQAEKALRRSKEDLELAVRGADIGIWNWDLRTGVIEASKRCRQLFGIPEGELLSYQRVVASVHPDDRPKMEPELRRALDEGTEYKAEKRFVWADGSVHWIECIGRDLYDETRGEPVGMRGISLDITQRKLAEEALRRSKEDLELAVRGANVGIWHWDMRTGVVELSDRCYQLFGLPVGEPLTFERYMSLVDPRDRERVEAALRRALLEGQEFKVEKRVVWPDGSIHWLEGIARELYDEPGHRPVGMRGVVFDITERKRQEEALQHSKEDLQVCVYERTAELTRANEALERSNLELQQFAFIAAHDLQTPLRSISGFAQLLQKDYGGRFDPQADAWLDQLVRYSRRMHDIIQDILAYSRVESRGSAFQDTDFNQLFDDVVATLDAPIRETHAYITKGDLPTVMGDRTQLAQVLQNLIDNAIKYHGDEPPRIHVSAARQGDVWLFAVEDKGIGIAEKHLETIFDIFRRLHTQQEYPGTGIGLAICRRVIHRHGGRIWAESRPGQGSILRFTLPDPGQDES